MNPSTLAKQLGLTEDEVLELTDLFVNTCSDDLNELQAAVDANDCKRVAEAAHSIKGASGNMRFDIIYGLAMTIESGARQQDLDGSVEHIGRIRSELEHIAAALKEHRK